MRFPRVALPAAVALAATTAACGGTPVSTMKAVTTTVAKPAATAPAPATRTLLRGLVIPAAWLEPGGLYVTTGATPAPATPETLLRLQPTTGAVEARTHFGAQVTDIAPAGRSLWLAAVVHSVKGAQEALLLIGVNPTTLAVEHKVQLPDLEGPVPHLAVAGGSLWVTDGGDLLRVNPGTGAITRTVATTAGSMFFGLAAGPGGASLVTSLGGPYGFPIIQRRSATTGTVLSETAPLQAVAADSVSLSGDSVWVSISTGMQGYAERLSLPGLKAVASVGKGEASNGIQAQVLAGVLYVTDPAGGANVNFCGNPATGAKRAAIKAGMLTAGSAAYYYVPNPAGATVQLDRAPVPAACR